MNTICMNAIASVAANSLHGRLLTVHLSRSAPSCYSSWLHLQTFAGNSVKTMRPSAPFSVPESRSPPARQRLSLFSVSKLSEVLLTGPREREKPCLSLLPTTVESEASNPDDERTSGFLSLPASFS